MSANQDGAERVAKKRIVIRDAAYMANAKTEPVCVYLDGTEYIARSKDVLKVVPDTEDARPISLAIGPAIVMKVGKAKTVRHDLKHDAMMDTMMIKVCI